MNYKQYDEKLIEQGVILPVSTPATLEDIMIVARRVAANNGGLFQINDVFDGPRYQPSAKNDQMASRRRIMAELIAGGFIQEVEPFVYRVN